jgi:hypothetical protein
MEGVFEMNVVYVDGKTALRIWLVKKKSVNVKEIIPSFCVFLYSFRSLPLVKRIKKNKTELFAFY